MVEHAVLDVGCHRMNRGVKPRCNLLSRLPPVPGPRQSPCTYLSSKAFRSLWFEGVASGRFFVCVGQGG